MGGSVSESYELSGEGDPYLSSALCKNCAPTTSELEAIGFEYSHYGYGEKGARRKVVLWSQAPWTSVEVIGEPTLPGGRFVAATTTTLLGEIRFIGVCIPWKDAHVRTGRKDRAAWDDHSHYPNGLQSVLCNTPMDRRILFGDFNQTIPRKRAPLDLFTRLAARLSNSAATLWLDQKRTCH